MKLVCIRSRTFSERTSTNKSQKQFASISLLFDRLTFWYLLEWVLLFKGIHGHIDALLFFRPLGSESFTRQWLTLFHRKRNWKSGLNFAKHSWSWSSWSFVGNNFAGARHSGNWCLLFSMLVQRTNNFGKHIQHILLFHICSPMIPWGNKLRLGT